ncbi:hypothetical protein BBJ28_00007629 [Nothophytophthora sp. Chile5]|nr:hypothetical protein BBJ28_00007629 [Nothophytophthora sp. Chile5]
MESEVALREMAKRVKIETVLKQYDVQAAASETDRLEQQEIILDIEMLLDESMALLSELDDDEDGESPMAGSFAFSSEGGAFELLEKMDGDELKEFFELALDEVLQSVEAALQEMSPDAAQGVRTTARQMKAMKDYSSYTFQRLDEAKRASIRRKFANHRLVELQQTFERLVIARTAQDRQLAYETSIFLFQLAQEEAVSAAAAEKEAEAEPTDSDTATAVTDATDCSNINFARRSSCNRCQTPRPEGLGSAGGAGGGEKPKAKGATDFRGPPGLFQAGDWTCNTCGNVNWERRNECNMCKSGKPTMSGLDGYDDFGMKKKVRDGSDTQSESVQGGARGGGAGSAAAVVQVNMVLYQPRAIALQTLS